ncbi:MAG TPA: hypothetical protein VFU36_01330, partial [Jatrophihabitans sp.]|nr:hypothetical protein [Jatrophihabitans sp.]
PGRQISPLSSAGAVRCRGMSQPKELQRLYQNPDFVPSLDLDHIGPQLSPDAGLVPAPARI